MNTILVIGAVLILAAIVLSAWGQDKEPPDIDIQRENMRNLYGDNTK